MLYRYSGCNASLGTNTYPPFSRTLPMSSTFGCRNPVENPVFSDHTREGLTQRSDTPPVKALFCIFTSSNGKEYPTPASKAASNRDWLHRNPPVNRCCRHRIWALANEANVRIPLPPFG